ncbi:MAG TPA: KH domain-containing protein [Candidatus Dojkabacteria bacterium]|nr:KH domain-containing protein [Candidatus Dojkabacteria bacterium]
MKELLEYIVKSIVNNPEEVQVEEKESVDFPGLTILTIDVAEDDKGVVIGRKGRTINAIRDLITINAIRTNRRVKVLIKDNDRDKANEERQEKRKATDESIFEDEI